MLSSKINKYFLIVIGTAITFTIFLELNIFLFAKLEFVKGTNWIFLPSGLRLLFVLLFSEMGAVGIVLASFIINYRQYYNGDAVNAVMTGCISGASPLIARQICLGFGYISENLEGLSTRSLLTAAVIFALTNSLLHQIWYVAYGQTQDFFTTTAVMAIGDCVGTIVVLYIAKFLIKSTDNKRLDTFAD